MTSGERGKKKRPWYKNNLGMKAFSLLLAILLYSWVHGAEDVRRTVDVDLLIIPPSEASGRILVSELPPRVRLTVHGSRSAINSMIRESLPPVEIDLRESRAADYYFGEEQFDLPAGVTITQMAPASVSLEWAERVERELPVELQTSGELHRGLVFAAPPEPRPDSVMVVGPETVLRGIGVIMTESVDLGALREGTVVRQLQLVPLPDHCRYQGGSTVHATFEVGRDLETRTFGALNIEAMNGTARRIRPSTLRVELRGVREAVRRIERDHLVPVVDLADVPSSGGHAVPITLRGIPAGIEVVAMHPPDAFVVR